MSKVIVVTGAAGGLGKTLSLEALSNGYSVALIGRDKAKLNSLKKELGRDFNEAEISVHSVNLCDEKAVAVTAKNILVTHKQIKAIINNAGTWMPSGQLLKTKAKLIKESLDLNFFTSFHLTQSLLNSVKSMNGISIINVGATASQDSWPEVFPFCAGKGLLYQYTKALAREIGKHGVHVAHVTIDGMLDNERTRKLNPKLNTNRYLRCESVAKDIFRVIEQDSSCWTMEWDIRPYNEQF